MKYCLLYIFAATLLVSCSKESKTPGGETPTSTVRFVANVPVKEDDWGLKTRGVVTDNVSIGTFGAFCFHTFKKWNEISSSALPNKMFDVEVLRTPSTNDWAYNPPVEWLEGNGNIFTFFGYSPHAKGVYHDVDNPNGNNIEVVSTAGTPGVPTVRYSTLDYVPLQVDLLFAKPIVDIRPVEKVQMQFSHALSQIRFRAWSRRSFVSVKSIEVSNVKYKATFAVDGSALTPEADVKTFLLENVNRTLSTDEQNPTELSDGANAFILLPQDLTSNATAQIVVTYEVGGKIETSTPYTIVQNWEANRSYTYLLTLGGPPTADMVVSGVTMTDWIVDSQEDMTTTNPVHTVHPPVEGQWVEIDGVKWTTGNLVAVNGKECKVGEPTDNGLYFTFGSLVGWAGGANGDGAGQGHPDTPYLRVKPYKYKGNPTDLSSAPHMSDEEVTIKDDAAVTALGDPCTYYLGAPWRLPIRDEEVFESLVKKSVVNAPNNGAAGFWVGGAVGAMEALFFPHSGFYDQSNGKDFHESGASLYWTNRHNPTLPGNSSPIRFYNEVVDVGLSPARNGTPIRCVSGTYTPPPPPPADSYIPTSVIKAAGWAHFPGSVGLQVAMRGDKQLPGSGTAATEDAKMQWKPWGSITDGVENVGSSADALFGLGKANTDAMVATPALAAEHPAAQYCRDMGAEWYLPNIKELKLIYDNRSVLGADYTFATSYYWSSTENSASNAWIVNVSNGGMYTIGKHTPSNTVRCVREI